MNSANKALPVRSNDYVEEFSDLIIKARSLRLSGVCLCCNFCKSNNESAVIYTSHNKEEKDGNTIITTCPVLANLFCTFCKSKGHTIKYCESLKKKKIQKLSSKLMNTHRV